MLQKSHYQLAYLACPYSSKDKTVQRFRFNLVSQLACDFITQGIYVFAASTHNTAIEEFGAVESRFEHWKNFNHTMIEHCDQLIVIRIDGWETSKGVSDQIKFAQLKGIPIEYYDPDPALLKMIEQKTELEVSEKIDF